MPPEKQKSLMPPSSTEFASLYHVGQELQLKDSDGAEVAKAMVLAYDPIADELSSSDHQGPIPPNHWHTAVHDSATQTWLPSAIWDRGERGSFEPHYSREHMQAERFGEPVAYSTNFVEKRVGAIAAQVAEIAHVEQKDEKANLDAPRLPIQEQDGYDLASSDVLDVPNGFRYVKANQSTNTSGDYEILYQGEPVGRASLTFGLRRKEVAFDISISRQGHNLGITALRSLAGPLSERGFALVTGGVSPHAVSYWEHLAQRGDVLPVNPSSPDTNYKVVPSTTVVSESST